MAAPQKIVNRAPEPVVTRSASPAATSSGRGLESPYGARFSKLVPSAVAQERMFHVLGKDLFRTATGDLIELPDDMTPEQAVTLELEAKAAEKRLGKGPPPVPVPNKRSGPKEIKKGTIKPTRGKKPAGATGKASAKAGASAALQALQAVGKSRVAMYLAAQAKPALVRGIGTLQRLRQNEQKHDDAGQKLQQSEQAVVIPTSEGQSKSNTGQVNNVEERPAPPVEEKVAKAALSQSIEENTPSNIEDVDNFKRDMKAQHMGSGVLQVVQADKNAVTATFGEMTQTPAPTPSDHVTEELPPTEVAPATPNLDLGRGAVAAPLPEHTDGSAYMKQADSKLTEEGVSQEQLDMVDSGDLAEANKEKKGLAKAIVSEPIAIQNLARQESTKVDQELKHDEKRERDGLRAKRRNGLSATAQKQKHTKSALEKKREEVASKINGIYQTAQDKVKKKLSDLETQSMKAFDVGNAKATKSFEDNVKSELDAFKDDRYSGWFGWARKAKDWLLGMDDLPAVKAIFDRNRAAFVAAIEQLVANITADNKRVIQECKDELAAARKTIKEYVDSLSPSLKGIGNKAASEMNSKLDELDSFIAKKEEELQNKLKDKQTAAIRAIDQKIEKMKEAMSGALSKLGKLLLLAAKKFFTWALSKVGFSLETIDNIINKGAAVLKAVFTKPVVFVKNLISAALLGFEKFGKNFLKHLKDALFEWLTGSLQGIALPKTWDFRGVVDVALQMIGISYANIRRHMVDVMGETTVVGLEKTFTLVKTLVTEGPMAAWEQLKEMAGEMREAFVQAVKDFIKQKIIEQAIQWLVSLFVPGAGIIKAVIGIYDTIVFFIQKAKQIFQMISNFLGSIAEIASGNIAAAADAMENGLARGLSLVISFLAKLLRLDGITAKIREAIQTVRAKVDAVLLKIAKWIAGKAKALIGSVKGAVGRVAEWWRQRKQFTTASGERHTLSYTGQPPDVVPMVASDEKPAEKHLQQFEKQASAAGASNKEKAGKGKIAEARALIKRDPGDPNLTVHMTELFNTYDAGEKETQITRKTGTIGGDVVGLHMIVDWLGRRIPAGSTPESGVHDKLMGLLITDPGKQSPNKFIRGHLLNEHLGGRGNGENMFPLTGNANSQHLHSTEKTVKAWVAKPKHWVRYEVKVEGVSSKLDAGAKSPQNYVNATFACDATLKDAAGDVKERFTTRIPSQYQARKGYDREDK